MGKRITMAYIARLARVSRTTVSLVLNNSPSSISAETRRRIWHIANELNYVPDSAARSLVTGHSDTLALLWPTTASIAPHLPLQVVSSGIIQAIRPEGYHLLLYEVTSENGNTSCEQLALSRRVDGILVYGPLIDGAEDKSPISYSPVVTLGPSSHHNLAGIALDTRQTAETVVAHLHALGHRHIGVITGNPAASIITHTQLDSFRQALASAGLPYDQQLVRAGTGTPDSGYQAMNSLLTEPRAPTAVFVMSDRMAAGALVAIRQHQRRVPEDISLVGLGDIPIAPYLPPGLTTMRVPAFTLGMRAGALLMALIKGEQPDHAFQFVAAELIIRASTAPPPP